MLPAPTQPAPSLFCATSARTGHVAALFSELARAAAARWPLPWAARHATYAPAFRAAAETGTLGFMCSCAHTTAFLP